MDRKQAVAKALQQKSGRIAGLLFAGVLLVGGATAVLSAHAQDRHDGPPPHPPGGMMLEGPPGMMGHHLERMLDGLGVTDAQRAQIRQIEMSAAADLRAQREASRGLREKGLEIFTAPTVDASAAESLRAQMFAQRDAASRRELQAMLDIARVLTPEQRAKIGARVRDHQAMMKDRMERMERMHADHGRMAPPPPPVQK